MAKGKNKLIAKILAPISFLILVDLIIVCMFSFTDLGTQTSIVEGLSENNEIFYIDNTCSEELLLQMNGFFNGLPISFKASMLRNKWKYIVCEEMPSILSNSLFLKNKYEDIENVTGITVRLPKISFIKTGPDAYTTFIHETGHIIEFELGYLSKTKEFKLLYDKYAKTYCDAEYYNSNKNEYFAYLFTKYYLEPDEFKEKAPNAYYYFDDILSQIITEDNIFEKMITRPVYLYRAFIE